MYHKNLVNKKCGTCQFAFMRHPSDGDVRECTSGIDWDERKFSPIEFVLTHSLACKNYMEKS